MSPVDVRLCRKPHGNGRSSVSARHPTLQCAAATPADTMGFDARFVLAPTSEADAEPCPNSVGGLRPRPCHPQHFG